MTRHEVIEILDGTHPTYGRGVALGIQAMIVVSAIAIALETLPDLPPGVHRALLVIEMIVLAAFLIEYILRIVCAERPIRYVFSFWGLVDLLACLPALALINTQWAAIRSLRLLRLVRLLKLMRTSRALDRLEKAFWAVRSDLMIFIALALMMLYIAAVGIYVFEHEAQPDVFTSIPISLWWAIATFTTVGYGDMVPITVGGRIFTSLILLLGLGIIAVPVAIITTALVNTEIDERIEEVEEKIGETAERPSRLPHKMKR